MDRIGHLLTSICVIVLLAMFIPNDLGLKEKMTFVLSLLIFSIIITPDIDLKIPFIPHRTVTHRVVGLSIIMILLLVISYTVLLHFEIKDAESIAFFIGVGLLVGWSIHIITDFVYDKIKQLTWLVLAIIMAAAWLYTILG